MSFYEGKMFEVSLPFVVEGEKEEKETDLRF